jgi:hypothetical protein
VGSAHQNKKIKNNNKMPVIRKLIRLGHSLTVGLPKEIQTILDVKRGDYVVWHSDKDNRIVLDKLSSHKHPGFFLPGSGWLNNGK